MKKILAIMMVWVRGLFSLGGSRTDITNATTALSNRIGTEKERKGDKAKLKEIGKLDKLKTASETINGERDGGGAIKKQGSLGKAREARDKAYAEDTKKASKIKDAPKKEKAMKKARADKIRANKAIEKLSLRGKDAQAKVSNQAEKVKLKSRLGTNAVKNTGKAIIKQGKQAAPKKGTGFKPGTRKKTETATKTQKGASTRKAARKAKK